MPYVINYREDGSVSVEFERKQAIQRSGKGTSEAYFPNSYVIIDLETTGLSPEYDEIIELGAIKVENGECCETYQSLVKPKCDIDEFIAELTGITNEMVASAPSIEEVLPAFFTFIGDGVVVGHNVSFDVNFIYDNRIRCFGEPFKNNYIDTLRISKKLYPDLSHHRLKDIVKLLNIEVSKEHRALGDCQTTYLCFEAMRKDALLKYPSEDDFKNLFKRKHKEKFDAHTLTTENTVFDETHPLYGKVCVFTGTLEKMIRKEAVQLVLDLGGICDNSVTKKTNYLILGNNDYCSSIKGGKSNKQKKAEELRLKGNDIEIIPEDVFYDMVAQKDEEL